MARPRNRNKSLGQLGLGLRQKPAKSAEHSKQAPDPGENAGRRGIWVYSGENAFRAVCFDCTVRPSAPVGMGFAELDGTGTKKRIFLRSYLVQLLAIISNLFLNSSLIKRK